MTLETERAILLRYTRDGSPRRGSGLRISGTYVLTADHCANGTDHTVIVDGRDYPATVTLRSGRSDVDIAVLSAPDLPVLAPMSCARVNTEIAARIEDCVALGFPTWNRRGGVDYRVKADGYVGTGEGASPHAGADLGPVLAFKLTSPAIRDRGGRIPRVCPALLLRVVAVLSPEGVRRNLLDTLNLGDMDESAEGRSMRRWSAAFGDRCCRGRSAGTR